MLTVAARPAAVIPPGHPPRRLCFHHSSRWR